MELEDQLNWSVIQLDNAYLLLSCYIPQLSNNSKFQFHNLTTILKKKHQTKPLIVQQAPKLNGFSFLWVAFTKAFSESEAGS